MSRGLDDDDTKDDETKGKIERMCLVIEETNLCDWFLKYTNLYEMKSKRCRSAKMRRDEDVEEKRMKRRKWF
jgi:hypothetical protein